MQNKRKYMQICHVKEINMTIHKETVDNRNQIVVESRGKKFIMGWFAGDLYWIMQDYTPAYLLITEKTSYFYEFFKYRI